MALPLPEALPAQTAASTAIASVRRNMAVATRARSHGEGRVARPSCRLPEGVGQGVTLTVMVPVYAPAAAFWKFAARIVPVTVSVFSCPLPMPVPAPPFVELIAGTASRRRPP